MRGALVLAALFVAVPLSGCIGGPGVAVVGLFSDWEFPPGSPAPVPVGDCHELLQVLNARTVEETDTLLDQSVAGYDGHWGWNGGRVLRGEWAATTMDAAEGATAAPTAAPSARDADVTGTNNQESGVDEADVLKTDGEWTYVLQDGMLYILHSEAIGNVSQHARIDLGAAHGGQLLLEPRDRTDPDDDRLIVITHGKLPDEERSEGGVSSDDEVAILPVYRSHTQIRVYSLADRSDPELLKEIWLEGDNVGARLVDGHAYVVVHSWSNDLPVRTSAHPSGDELEARGLTWDSLYSMTEENRTALRTEIAEAAKAANRDLLDDADVADHLPRVREKTGDALLPRPVDDDACARFLLTENATGRSLSTILSLHVAGDEVTDAITQALGSRPIVYGAEDALVLAAPSRDAWWFWDRPEVDEATDLQWYDLDGLDVQPRASGRVPGIVQDSFGIDVHDDTLRVATTTGQWGRWWIEAEEREPMMNHLVVLGAEAGALVPLGLVGGIAPGERIWSARFTDTRAYIVTFEQIDPLWIIDLTDATAPQILGELEIPGVSTYIHPLSDEWLLTIGIGPGAEGRGLDWSRIQVSLFDVSDESAPERADLMDVTPPGGWSWSGATHEHKAFTYWDRLGMLAVPVSTNTHDGGTYRQHIALRLIEVDTERGELRLHGEVDQDDLVPSDADGRHSWYRADIERSYFLGLPDEGIVSVYALSRLGVTAHDLETLTEQDRVRFVPREGGDELVMY